MQKRLSLVILAGLTLFGCALSDHTITPTPVHAYLGQITSGVQGQVLLGAIHSGPPQAGDNDYVGFAALFYVYDDRGILVTTFNSDWNGWFNVALSPGHYVIIADSSTRVWDPQSQAHQVAVVQGKFLNVIFRFSQVPN